MPTRYALPNAAAMTQMFDMLFGGKVPVMPGKRLDTKAGSGNLVAIFVADDGNPVAAAICDLAFAANGGAALSMLPVSAAKDAIKAKKLEQTMFDNLYEIMNVVSTLLMNEHTPHLKLTTLYPDPGKLPADAKALLSAATAGHADFNVNVLRYGSGGMSLLTL
ncbi:MAG: hypothetical protein IPL59_26270 [Candidatus Competibacteraceae bacterium]|uniref:Uncharacterized protein n=1 Tax=Candidatus Contendobacter odensis Run_B_J11 TaxID=1400861 RepID=A0A7U7GF08_9GAMM|nr:hypothetical protein [Candidatus Contendobacter odensis]MBK8538280.1 hypothetical protein [Candidatus Competibacteraceae bacterium]MBK8754189.1 hypothetical protein [Candidatus Competibacteraceae bacterium]CDH47141.1 conserved hypothetical protein [Candidatus Contendobacter odensis Run_B_J11]